ncbi:MAG: hypothetical protein MUC95_05065 [Spirochaetes bacterium]|nr:hypothetical protein [Spirochaetota bacterium]
MITLRRLNFIIPLFLFLYLLVSPVIPLSAGEKEVEVKWKDVPRAYGYLVEIKNDKDKVVIQQRTNDSFLNFSLIEGDYQARISALNKFQKIAVSSKWFAVRIRQSLKPEFISISQSEFVIGPHQSAAVISGKDFQEYCRVSFRNNGVELDADETSFISREKLDIKIYASKFQPGYYDIIITNPGGSSASAEEKIFFGYRPEFLSVSPSDITLSGSGVPLEISGDRFDKDCAVTLSQGGTSIKPEKTERLSEKNIRITVNPLELREGFCSIIISNYGKLSVSADNVLNLIRPPLPPKTPLISSITPSSIAREDKNINIKIRGSGILEGCAVSFMMGDTAVLTGTPNVNSDTAAVISINPSALTDGKYSIKITNPGNASSEYKNKLEIYTKRAPIGIYFGISPLLSYNLVLFDWGKIINNSFKGFNLYAGYEPEFFKTVAPARRLGIEFNFDITRYSSGKSNTDQIESEMTTILSSFGIYYKNNFSMPVDFLVRLGSGLACSNLKTYDKAAGSSESFRSYDPYIYAGPSVRYTFSSFLFTEAGADYQFINYIENHLNIIHSFLRIGVIF